LTQSSPAAQVPHEPPQPLSPHSKPEHTGWQPQTATTSSQHDPFRAQSASQEQPAGAVCPQIPSQEALAAMSTQVPESQVFPVPQMPHWPPQPSSPQVRLPQVGAHSTHWPSAPQKSNAGLAHEPHCPPHPSGPHSRPSQSATQATQAPEGQLSPVEQPRTGRVASAQSGSGAPQLQSHARPSPSRFSAHRQALSGSPPAHAPSASQVAPVNGQFSTRRVPPSQSGSTAPQPQWQAPPSPKSLALQDHAAGTH